MYKILFLSKSNDEFSRLAYDFLLEQGYHVDAYFGAWGDVFPNDAKNWQGDIIISYLSRWIVSNELLKKAKLFSINFHPAPPEYRGIGGYNFALYHNDKEYGVTCHIMDKSLDSGQIIRVDRFPISSADNLESLIIKSNQQMIQMFKEVFPMLLINLQIMTTLSEERWVDKIYSRRDLNKLMNITLDMNFEEVQRRIRATTYLDYGPYIIFHGYKFKLDIKG